jgi:hypothetical protein
MKKMTARLLITLMAAAVASEVWAYGEGPSDSGRWIYGRVSYRDGSKCGNCCQISVETESGFSKDGCTDEGGDYRIYVLSEYARAVYFHGSKVWSGSQSTKGGVRIDITAR